MFSIHVYSKRSPIHTHYRRPDGFHHASSFPATNRNTHFLSFSHPFTDLHCNSFFCSHRIECYIQIAWKTRVSSPKRKKLREQNWWNTSKQECKKEEMNLKIVRVIHERNTSLSKSSSSYAATKLAFAGLEGVCMFKAKHKTHVTISCYACWNVRTNPYRTK